jgi:secreted trypsin-like serine protease
LGQDPEDFVTRRPSLLLTLVLIAATLSALMGAVVPDYSGKAARDDRNDAKTEVIRGVGVPDGKYPFVAAVGVANASGSLKRLFCGGSLIAPSYVLTAAHCVVGAKTDQIAVVVGQTAFDSGQGESRTLTAIMIHPSFSLRTLRNDVALLQLSAPIQSISPVALVGAGDGSFDVAGTGLTVVGWGNTVRSGHNPDPTRYPDRLQEGAISVIDNASCAKQWRRIGFKKSFSPSLLLCTSARRFAPGDSGSPVFSTTSGTFVQVSLVSGGFTGTKKKVADFGPRLSDPAIAAFIATSIGA